MPFDLSTARPVQPPAAAASRRFDIATAQAQRPEDDSALRAIGLGIYEPIDNLSRRLLQTDVGQAINSAGVALGLPDSNTTTSGRYAARANNSRTGYQVAGNIVGTLPTLAIPGGPVAQGAASGAVLSNEDTLGGVAGDAAIGGIAGKVGDMVTRGAARVIAPQVNRGLRLLSDAGIPMTLGQIAAAGGSRIGRAVKGIEDRAAGLPVVGDVINAARQRGTEAYNRTVMRRALGRAGLQLPDDVPVGREGVQYVGDRLSAQYQQLLPRLAARPDAQFSADLLSASQTLQTVPTEVQGQFQSVLRAAFQNRGNGPTLAGDNLKAAEEVLTDFASRYRSAGDPNQRALGEAVGAVRDGLRQLVVRQNGQAGAQLQRINNAWRELTILERAAGGQGNHNGVFSPKQYAAAARASDTSARRRATTRGTAPNQRMTDAAAGILPNTVPDSGTAGRLAAGAGIVGIGTIEPTTAVGLATLAAPYTAVGQNAANWLYFANRPALVRRGAALLRQSAPVVGTASAVTASQ